VRATEDVGAPSSIVGTPDASWGSASTMRARHHAPLSAVAGVLLVALAGCGARQPPRKHADEIRVSKIDISGNRSVDTDTLLDGLALTRQREAGQEFDPYLVGQDAERVRGYYLRHGYFRAQVTPSVDQHGNTVDIVYKVQEGPLARLKRVEIAGLPPDDTHVKAEDIRKLIPLDDGQPFDYEPYDKARPLLVGALERAGYAYARVEAKVAADVIRDEAIIRLEFTPGPLCTFGEVRVHGVKGELGEAAIARIEAHQGERYSSKTLADTQESLYAMNRFASVRIEPDRSSGSAVVPVEVYLAEQTPHELKLGGGFGIDPTSYEIRGRALYTIAGWPRPLVTTHLELKPAYVFMRDGHESEPRMEAAVSVERLDLFVPRLVGELEVAYAYLAIEAYTSYGPRTRAALRYPLYRRYIQGSVGWQLRYLDFTKFDPAVDNTAEREKLGLISPYLLGFYEQNVYFDFRDDPVEPRLGLYAEMRAEEGTKAAGGDFDYFKLTPEVRGYVPLGHRFVIAAKGRFGTILGDLPVTQRYFAGGASSQRGFPERQLAPIATTMVDGNLHSVVVGGGALLESSAELRAPLGTAWSLKFGGVLFLDGADVTERQEDLDVMNLHWAVGAGLRVATPIGPARIDVGYRLNRTGPGEPLAGEHFAYHLSLGEAF
jgi:translocation and assembly module TamA